MGMGRRLRSTPEATVRRPAGYSHPAPALAQWGLSSRSVWRGHGDADIENLPTVHVTVHEPPSPVDLRGIRVCGITKRFGPVRALNGIDFAVGAGEVVALLGRNGAGKTTLIRVLATSVVPDEGEARVNGHDVVAHPLAARAHTGLVLGEDRSFFWRLTGRQNLEFFSAMHGMRRKEARTASERALSAVELSAVADRRVDRYSTGMRSRLGIARALLNSPSVLLLDEPTRSLDPESAHGVRAVVKGLVDKEEVTVLIATHDLHEAAVLASSVLIMSAGKVVDRCVGQDAAALEASLLSSP
jgi:ABC-2 type transport system ATP-binding protein